MGELLLPLLPPPRLDKSTLALSGFCSPEVLDGLRVGVGRSDEITLRVGGGRELIWATNNNTPR